MKDNFTKGNKYYDTVIVGGGVAGSLLTLQLNGLGKKVMLISKDVSQGSSSLAAGLINPITGRHFVKSWKINALLEVCDRVYGSLERQYDKSLVFDLKVVRALKSAAMLNEWSSRVIDPDYHSFIDEGNIDLNPGLNKTMDHYGLITQARRVDFEQLMTLVQEVLATEAGYQKEQFNHDELRIENDLFHYRDLTAKRLVFCEGAEVRNNPYWNWLPLVPAKGERLIIHSPQLKLLEVYNDGKVIIPIGNDEYWVGSNYEWEELDHQPTQKVKETLISFLDDLLNVPYELVDHSARIRPASYNRRPFVGRHPELQNCYIINGLGAKGASLSPYCVEQLINFMNSGEALDPEISTERVFDRYQSPEPA